MREQIAYRQSSVPQRASVPAASRTYARHSAGLHSEEDEEDYPQATRPGTSTIRYTDRDGHSILRKGNRQIVVHEEPPPKKHRITWMLFFIAMFLTMVFGYAAIGALGTWWQSKLDDWTYAHGMRNEVA